MKNIKNISIATTMAAVSFATIAQSVFAQPGGAAQQVNTCPQGAGFSTLCNITPGAFVGGLISFFFVIAGIFALFYLVWGGFKWITSGGDKTAIEGARGHIIAAVVGLIIIFLAYVIMNLVWQFFFKQNFNSIQLPTL